jgi:competence protein ComEC
MLRPLVRLAVAVALGSALASELPASACAPLLGASAVLVGVALLRPAERAAWLALLAAACGLGAAARVLERARYERADVTRLVARGPSGPVWLAGHLRADALPEEGRLRLLLDVEQVRTAGALRACSGRVRIDVGGQGPWPELRAGDGLALWASLRAPQRSGEPAGFDAQAHARRAGLHAHGYCKSARLLESRPPAPSLTHALATLRARVRQHLLEHLPAGREQALVRAMVLGDRAGLDDELEERFRAAGTYHVLALSGAQVGVLTLALLGLARRLRLGPGVSALGLSLLLGSYALLVGGDVPVVRAVLMAGVVALGRVFDLRADAANLLGGVAAALLVVQPSVLGDVGFQLSFLATWALVTFTAPIAARLPRLPWRLEWGLAGSLAAQVGLLPLLAWHFNRLAPAALVLNLAAVPLSSAVLALGACVAPAALLAPWLGDRLGDLAWIAAHALVRSADPLAWWPALDVRVPDPALWALALHAAALAALARGRRPGRALAMLSLALAGVVAGRAAQADGRLHLTVLDVGQGDALVLRSPSGRALLVDAGPDWNGPSDAGRSIVAAHIWRQGLRGADGLFVSHAHPDHVGGAVSVLRLLRVPVLYEAWAVPAEPGYAALAHGAARARVRRVALRAGQGFAWDGAWIQARSPRPTGGPRTRVRNDDSLVLEVSFGAVRLLLPGDLEAQGEQAWQGRADVLKVPHHGSRTSSSAAFLARLHARLALVPVGAHNVFGHPHPEVLARYAASGIALYRGDRDGSVTVSTDGRRLWVRSTFDPVERRLP